ncbi:MAG: aldolase/citrate lyase family protein [Sphaerochaetaceae bacterium]
MLNNNTLKEKIKNGKVCLGSMFPFNSTGLVELIGKCKVDFITFDSEHGPLNYSEIEDLARTCELVGVTPLCRIPAAKPEIILRTMDAGVMGIVCPHVKSREVAELLVANVKYPPMGKRGLAMTARAPGYSGMTVEEYTVKSNNETMVIAQIEDLEGVENIDSILKVKGLDAIFIGRNDLTLSMGYQGNVNASEVQEVIEEVTRKTLEAKLELMIATDEVEGIPWINKGAKLLSMHIVPFVRRKVVEAVNIVQEAGKQAVSS